ncbi:Bug family tripartite tricarboxylate transporter substrate binding protein [Parapusillimonas sp. JC17]|uniref:Bug family tripartite tricarboxylate transporter substrate binding protein n=1 Tax=Parapusillimonas sp. JC17 TaxID=3445768 RepID=UPI003FA0F7E3
MKSPFKTLLAAGSSILLMTSSAVASAKYPEAPVTFVVPGPAGSGTDAIGRLLADEFSRMWGQPVVVENRAGASGMIGTQYLLRAAPDGYTILLGHVSTHSIVPAVRRPAPYHPVKDFAAIGKIGTSSNVLVVAGNSPIRTLKDLSALGRNGNTVSYGSPGVGLSQHFNGFTFGQITKTDMLHVPYKGSGPAMTDLIGGRINMMFVTPPAAKSAVDSGQLRALAQTSEQRQKAFPNTPTFAELGMPELTSLSWWGLFAPAGTPAEAVRVLNQSLEKTLQKPEVQRQLEAMVIEPAEPVSPEDFKDFVGRDFEVWNKLVEESGIRIQG